MIVRTYGAIGVVIAVASCNYDWTYRPTDAGTTLPEKDTGGGTNPNEDAGSPSPCSTSNPICPSGQYCRFIDRACGTQNPDGECRDVNVDCKPTSVCTCAKMMMDGCVAQQKGTDVDETGLSCGSKDTFACGPTQCKVSAEACVDKPGGDPFCVECVACPCKPYEGTCTCKEQEPGVLHVQCP